MSYERLTDDEIQLLNEDQCDRYYDFLASIDHSGCSCHIKPPCNTCTHEGHAETIRMELDNVIAGDE